MSAKAKNRLSDLEAIEVSLVPKGANKKKFMLFKTDNEEGESMTDEEMKLVEEVLKTELPDDVKSQLEEVLKQKKLSDKAQNAVKGALRLLNSVKEEVPAPLKRQLAGLVGYGYPPPGGKADHKEEDKDKMKKSDEGIDLEKVPKEIRPQLEALWKEHKNTVKKNQELMDEIKKSEDARKTKDYIAKAESDFPKVSADPKEFGPVLKEISERCSKETYEKLEGVLKAANEQIEKGDLFKEKGSDAKGSLDGDAWAKIEKMAAEKVQKSSKPMTKEQAVDSVINSPEGAKLYGEYENDQVRRAG